MIYSPRQRIMVNYLYDKDNLKYRITRGEDFIHHFITSNEKTDTRENKVVQKYRFFSDKKIALKRVNEFFEVLDDLTKNKIIDVHKRPEEKHNIKFILSEPQKEKRDFIEFNEIFDEYVNADFEIIDKRKFDRFMKQKYLHDFDYQDKRFKEIHIGLAKILMIITIITFIISTIIGIKQCSSPQKIIIENKSLSKDILDVHINKPIITEIDSLKNMRTTASH